MKTFLRISLLLVLSFSIISCDNGLNKKTDVSLHDSANFEKMKRIWGEYNLSASYDSLISSAKPFMELSKKKRDTLSVLYAGAYIAQSFIFLEELDSVEYYLDMIAPYRKGTKEKRVNVMIDNILGIHAIKSELNYSKALEYFKQMYESVKNTDDLVSQLVSLTNIVNIFYIKSDKYGMDYARQAIAMAEKLPDVGIQGKYYHALAMLSMAQMTYLSGDYDSALEYVSKADSLTASENMAQFVVQLALLKGDIYCHFGQNDLAEKCYKTAVEHESTSEPGIVSLVYLNYGRFYERLSMIDKAISLYEQGVDLSYKHKNMLFRSELLRRLADLYYQKGDRERSFFYSRDYSKHLDSLSISQTEQEFNALLLSYQNMEHKNEIQAKELDVLKANKRSILILGVFIVVMILSLSLFFSYRKQKKMNKVLVMQHQNYIQRLNMNSALSDDSAVREESERDLFQKIERLMKDEKFYRHKDISLDKLAENLGTNRTYISKAINRYSGMSFSGYVNMYRINEATAIISSSERDILLKQLADELGYNSVTVFSKAFQKETGLSPSKYRKEMISGMNKQDNS